MGALMCPRSPDKYIRFGGPSGGVSFYQGVMVGAVSSSKASPDRLLSSHEALHLTPVTALASTEDGSLLLTGAVDGTCRLWAVVTLQTGSGQVCGGGGVERRRGEEADRRGGDVVCSLIAAGGVGVGIAVGSLWTGAVWLHCRLARGLVMTMTVVAVVGCKV